MTLRKWYCTNCKYCFENGIVNGVKRYICTYEEEYVPIPKNSTPDDPTPHCYEMIDDSPGETRIVLDFSNKL